MGGRSVFARAIPVFLSLLVAVVSLRGAAASPLAAPVQSEAPPNLSGVWEAGSGDYFSIAQQADSTSIDSIMLKDTCTGGPRDYVIRGDVQGTSLSGTMQRCDAADHFLVENCGLPTLWETPFTATYTRNEIVGTYQGEYWMYDIDEGGNVVNCSLDYYFDVDFSFPRVDCGVLTFEELAERYVLDASETAEQVDLAKQFEGGQQLAWTDGQLAPGGLKEKVEEFREFLISWGYSSRINSAYRPLLYQGHFADLRLCALQLVHTITGSPELAEYLADSANKVNAEVSKHAIKSQVFNVGGLEVKVPYVCYREPLTDCPHVDERAVDMTINPDDATLDWIGAMRGFCRPYRDTVPPDRPHWEHFSTDPFTTPKCNALGPGPGEAVIDIEGDSPINILVQDPLGRRIGYDVVSAIVVNDFGADLALYSGAGTQPQIISISADATLPGSYLVTGVGTGDGEYTLSVSAVNFDGISLDSKNTTGRASADQAIEPLEYTLREDYSPDSPWTAGEAVSTVGDTTTFGVTVGGRTYDIGVTGGDFSSLMFSDEGEAIALRSDGRGGTTTVSIPGELLGPEFTVRVDGKQVPASISESGGNYILTFEVPVGSEIVTIEGNKPSAPAPSGQLDLALVALGIAGAVAVAAVVAVALIRFKRRDRKQ